MSAKGYNHFVYLQKIKVRATEVTRTEKRQAPIAATQKPKKTKVAHNPLGGARAFTAVKDIMDKKAKKHLS